MIFAKPMTAPQQVEFGGPLESAVSPPRLSRCRTVCLTYTLGGGEVPLGTLIGFCSLWD